MFLEIARSQRPSIQSSLFDIPSQSGISPLAVLRLTLGERINERDRIENSYLFEIYVHIFQHNDWFLIKYPSCLIVMCVKFHLL